MFRPANVNIMVSMGIIMIFDVVVVYRVVTNGICFDPLRCPRGEGEGTFGGVATSPAAALR